MRHSSCPPEAGLQPLCVGRLQEWTHQARNLACSDGDIGRGWDRSRGCLYLPDMLGKVWWRRRHFSWVLKQGWVMCRRRKSWGMGGWAINTIMMHAASFYFCGAWALGNKALLDENYFLLLAPLAYISSIKKNGVTQPTKTQPLLSSYAQLREHLTGRSGEKVGGDGFIVLSVPSKNVGQTQGPALW